MENKEKKEWFGDFRRALSRHGPVPLDQTARTSAMEKVIHGMARRRRLVSVGKGGTEHGIKSEFWTVDFCWFQKADWDHLPDPGVPPGRTRLARPFAVIEHENSPDFWKLLYAWWKLEPLHAHLRILVGYPECPRKARCNKDHRECFAQALTKLRTPPRYPLSLGLLVLGKIGKDSRMHYRPWLSDTAEFVLQKNWGEA